MFALHATCLVANFKWGELSIISIDGFPDVFAFNKHSKIEPEPVNNFLGYHANSLKISESRPLAGLGLTQQHRCAISTTLIYTGRPQ